jgi:hypothetical protein
VQYNCPPRGSNPSLIQATHPAAPVSPTSLSPTCRRFKPRRARTKPFLSPPAHPRAYRPAQCRQSAWNGSSPSQLSSISTAFPISPAHRAPHSPRSAAPRFPPKSSGPPCGALVAAGAGATEGAGWGRISGALNLKEYTGRPTSTCRRTSQLSRCAASHDAAIHPDSGEIPDPRAEK